MRNRLVEPIVGRDGFPTYEFTISEEPATGTQVWSREIAVMPQMRGGEAEFR